MGKYYCTRHDVEDVLGEAMPQNANRNDVLDAVRAAHDRVAAVVEDADTGRVEEDVMARRLNLATAGLAAHRLLMRAGIMDLDIRTRKRQALALLERIQNGEYAREDVPVVEEEDEPTADEADGPAEGDTEGDSE